MCCSVKVAVLEDDNSVFKLDVQDVVTTLGHSLAEIAQSVARYQLGIAEGSVVAYEGGTLKKIYMICESNEMNVWVRRPDTDLIVVCKKVSGRGALQSKLYDSPTVPV